MCLELLPYARFVREVRDLLCVAAVDCLPAFTVTAERQPLLLEYVFVFGRVGCVDRDRGEREADDPGDVLPRLGAGELVDARQNEPEACRGEHEAGMVLDASAEDAGAHIAKPAMRRKSPSASLVDPGLPVRVTRPTVAQMPLSMPMPVAATPSRERKPKIEAVNCSGTVNARTHRATCFPSVGATHPSCIPATTNVAAASPKKPSASGPASGRNTMRVRDTSSSRAAFRRGAPSSDHQRLRGARLDARQEPFRLRLGLGVALGRRAASAPVSRSLAACEAMTHVIAPPLVRRKSKRGPPEGPRSVPIGVCPFGVAAISLGDRGELRHSFVDGDCEGQALVVHVLVVRVAFAADRNSAARWVSSSRMWARSAPIFIRPSRASRPRS